MKFVVFLILFTPLSDALAIGPISSEIFTHGSEYQKDEPKIYYTPSQKKALKRKRQKSRRRARFFRDEINFQQSSASRSETEMSGTTEFQIPISGQLNSFPYEPVDPSQNAFHLSFATQPKLSYLGGMGRSSFNFSPFFRWDQQDENRTHFDIRELDYTTSGEKLELRIGIRQVFWGVTESHHLVDIINQSDIVESLDGEEKLGQPMINLAWFSPIGTADLYLMSGFRERTFPSLTGRPRTEVPIDSSQVTYESELEQAQPDVAVRLSDHVGVLDYGIYHFYGTARNPVFNPSTSTGSLRLLPEYRLIHRNGVDAQLTTGALLTKFEGITETDKDFNNRYYAAVGGFEYTFSNLFSTGIDFGILTEYLYDSRGETLGSIFEDDLFGGSRIALNNSLGTQFLFGAIVDRSNLSSVFKVEASSRLSDSLKLALQGQHFFSENSNDPVYQITTEGFGRLELTYYLNP